MDRVLINPSIVSGIADAVREKTKTSEPIMVSELPEAIRGIRGGSGENVKEVVEAVSGVVSDDDVVLANGIAEGATDAPSEQTWSGERQTAGGVGVKDSVAFMDKVKGNTIKVEQSVYSMSADKVVSRGRNLWDEEWEEGYYQYRVGEKMTKRYAVGQIRCKNTISVDGGKTYYFKTKTTLVVQFYDDSDTIIINRELNNSTLTIPSNAVKMTFYYASNAYNNDVCINRSDNRTENTLRMLRLRNFLFRSRPSCTKDSHSSRTA